MVTGSSYQFTSSEMNLQCLDGGDQISFQIMQERNVSSTLDIKQMGTNGSKQHSPKSCATNFYENYRLCDIQQGQKCNIHASLLH